MSAARQAMRVNPHAFAEGLGAWLSGAKDELGLEAAECAAVTFAEILLVLGRSAGGRFGE